MYGLTAEELDFAIHYDIKYRLHSVTTAERTSEDKA